MFNKKNKSKYKNLESIEVVFSIEGRIRLRVSKSTDDALAILNDLKENIGIIRGSYTNITNTFVLEYDSSEINLNKLIMSFCGIYSKTIGAKRIKLKYRLSKKHALGYTSILSLSAILADLGISMFGIGTTNIPYRSFIRWCAIATTIGAIFEHGYKELNENGAFDPEVMSIMYLLNSVNSATKTSVLTHKGEPFYPAAIAWLLTFGRHILTRQDQTIIISVVSKDGEIKLIEEENKSFFFNQFVGSCFDIYQNVNVKKSLASK